MEMKSECTDNYQGYHYIKILKMHSPISWSEFESVELRVGTIIRVEDFPEARKRAYKIWVDFGDAIGTKQTSAQITVHYTKESLIGKQII
jgi:tRNA-binding protein